MIILLSQYYKFQVIAKRIYSKAPVVQNRQIANRALCRHKTTEGGLVFQTPYSGVLCTVASDSAAKACPAVIVYFVQREPSKK